MCEAIHSRTPSRRERVGSEGSAAHLHRGLRCLGMLPLFIAGNTLSACVHCASICCRCLACPIVVGVAWWGRFRRPGYYRHEAVPYVHDLPVYDWAWPEMGDLSLDDSVSRSFAQP
jgi:hypothetical protein